MKSTLILLAFTLVGSFTHAATIEEQANAFFARGQAAEQRGDAEIAAICYQLAIRAKPDHLEAQTRILEIGKLSGVIGPTNQLTGKLILPQVRLSGATLDEAIEFFRVKSRELDPFGRGVDIILFPTVESSRATISLDLKNVPLDEALRYTTKLAGATHRWDDGRVLVLPLDQQSPALQVVSNAKPMEKASLNPAKWVLPKVQFARATLDEVLNNVKMKSKEIDPLSKGVEFAILDASGKPTSASTLSKATINLALQQISMEGLLRYIAELAGVSIQLEGSRIVVSGGLAQAPPETSPTVAAKPAIPPAPQSTPEARTPPAPATASDPATRIHAWTNQSGVTVNAAFIGLDGDAVVIRKDGKEFTIPFSKLNTASQEQAMKLAVAHPAP